MNIMSTGYTATELVRAKDLDQHAGDLHIHASSYQVIMVKQGTRLIPFQYCVGIL